eukprot:jgi/Bigna1/130363/aug1.11_g5071
MAEYQDPPPSQPIPIYAANVAVYAMYKTLRRYCVGELKVRITAGARERLTRSAWLNQEGMREESDADNLLEYSSGGYYGWFDVASRRIMGTFSSIWPSTPSTSSAKDSIRRIGKQEEEGDEEDDEEEEEDGPHDEEVETTMEKFFNPMRHFFRPGHRRNRTTKGSIDRSRLLRRRNKAHPLTPSKSVVVPPELTARETMEILLSPHYSHNTVGTTPKQHQVIHGSRCIYAWLNKASKKISLQAHVAYLYKRSGLGRSLDVVVPADSKSDEIRTRTSYVTASLASEIALVLSRPNCVLLLRWGTKLLVITALVFEEIEVGEQEEQAADTGENEPPKKQKDHEDGGDIDDKVPTSAGGSRAEVAAAPSQPSQPSSLQTEQQQGRGETQTGEGGKQKGVVNTSKTTATTATTTTPIIVASGILGREFEFGSIRVPVRKLVQGREGSKGSATTDCIFQIMVPPRDPRIAGTNEALHSQS